MGYTMDYSQEIENAVKNNIISASDIYDFRESPLENILSLYYAFCRKNLDIHSANEKITPNIFLINNSTQINAHATLTPAKFFVISLTLGLLKYCYSNYFENLEFHKYFKAHYPETVKMFDNSSNVLAFQICIQFTYYHELAHLFQFRIKTNEIAFNERNNNTIDTPFDRINHVLEINADTYASISVATHIEQYIRNAFEKDISYQLTFNTIRMFCCCLLNYSISLTEKNEEVYFEAHTHPHSFIRLLNIILNISNHIEESTYFKEKNIKIESTTLFISVIETYKDLESKNIFSSDFSGIIDKSKGSINKITDYLYSISQFDTKEYGNAMDVWNKHIP